MIVFRGILIGLTAALIAGNIAEGRGGAAVTCFFLGAIIMLCSFLVGEAIDRHEDREADDEAM